MYLLSKKTRVTVLTCALMAAILIPAHLGLFTARAMASPSTGLTSWNPNVNCTPTLVTVEQIVGNQTGPQGGATQGGSVVNTGSMSPCGPGNAKRWLTTSSSSRRAWTSSG